MPITHVEFPLSGRKTEVDQPLAVLPNSSIAALSPRPFSETSPSASLSNGFFYWLAENFGSGKCFDSHVEIVKTTMIEFP